MRWPLRNQILTRMLLLLVITIVSLTYANIHSGIAASRKAELDRIDRLVELMTTSKFPLTSSILENMKLLSGAEFVFTKRLGKVVAKTSQAPAKLPDDFQLNNNLIKSSIPKRMDVRGQPFYHTAIPGIRDRTAPNGVIHIFVPIASELSIWWQASSSPLTIALFVFPLALLLSLALASQVTRPLAKLNHQVQHIAEGDVQPIPEVQRNDEIRDLNVSINEMAMKLTDHDVQQRKTERLRTMVQFGSGIAHHLRNSATGCKMAVELLAVEQRAIAESENYQVAIRQLQLMDNYIKKFLLLSKSSETNEESEIEAVRLGEVLENVIFLLRPSAEHLGVELAIKSICDGSKIYLSQEDAQQLMMNLITNAIRAASENSPARKHGERGQVSVELFVNDGRVEFLVHDDGSGPPIEIAESLFEPFVTGAREGTGLGLSLVQEISKRANGCVRWQRDDGITTFRFALETQPEVEMGGI